MKDYFLLCLLMLSTLSVASQVKYQLDSISDYGGDPHKYVFNDKHQNTEDITMTWNCKAPLN